MNLATTKGHKADGLSMLPSGWVPGYVVIDSALARRLGADLSRKPHEIASWLASSPVYPKLHELLAGATEGIIVRSSALTEDMSARGLYQSKRASFASLTTLAEAAAEVWTHARQIRPDADPIPLVAQRLVSAELLGHLANERRLRPDRRDWVVELQGPLSETRTSGMRAVRKERKPLEEVTPVCGSADALRDVLRDVASALTSPGRRFHLEWVWDGTRLWLVQCDAMVELESSRPRATGHAEPFPDLETFRPVLAADSVIPKLRCVAEYAAAGLPHADLRVLRNGSLLSRLHEGASPRGLVSDLERLSKANAVIRTDVRSAASDFDLLRPRTETGWTAQQMLDFLRRTTTDLIDGGVAPDDIAYMTHPFIPADAAAWSVAAPAVSQVRIDATFGLPDGLLYYSHDSYEVDLRTDRVRARPRCKSPILLCDEDGAWRDHPLGSPWDWKLALSDAEGASIATMSKRLADYLERPVEIMFFVRARVPNADEPILLPWVHLSDEVGPLGATATESHFPSRVIEVRGTQDLELLEEAGRDADIAGARFIVRLQPEGRVLHDSSFLESLIDRCPIDRCTVELAGSTLSHVYYTLVRAGLQVRVIDPLEPSSSEPIAFDKLVRDLIPDNIAARGERVRAYRASGPELERLLKRKILEEAFEVANASSTNELMEELGDVIDVLTALSAVSGTDFGTVTEWAEKKRRERGGFEHGVVLVDTREPSLAEAVADSNRTYSFEPEFVPASDRPSHARGEAAPEELEEELRVPYQIAFGAGGRTARIVIGGTEYELMLDQSGVVIRRVDSVPGPGQLTLDV